MDGSFDEYMDGWVDGWMNGWVDGWIGGWVAGWLDGRMDTCISKMKGWMINRQMCGCMDRLMN